MSDSEWPISAERLRTMIQAVESGADIDADVRAEISSALKYLRMSFVAHDDARQKGRPEALLTWSYAFFVLELVNRYHVTVREACRAVAPAAPPKILDRLERAYRKIKAGECPYRVPSSLNEDSLALYASRLPSGARRGRIIRFR